MPQSRSVLDELDLRLLELLRARPRAGVLELSREAKVARATAQARLDRMEAAGVITGYGPDIDVAAAGFGVTAFVTLEIAQGGLDQVRTELEAISGVLEAYVTTGTGDVLCRIAAASHEQLQDSLLALNRSAAVTRSTSVIALSVLVPPRVLPLLASEPLPAAPRAPAYRETS
jgi:DNA-binding Lrp family transcriptional regulator